jgi:hypothetical protein
VDLFQKQSFSVTACVNLSRCLIAAAGAAAIQPLIQAVGVGWAFTVCAGIALASCPFALAVLSNGGIGGAQNGFCEEWIPDAESLNELLPGYFTTHFPLNHFPQQCFAYI